MRGQALVAVAALSTALMAVQPASAQNYDRNYSSYGDAYAAQSYECERARNGNTAGGAILGGILGAVIGSHASANRHRSDGSLVGAAAGALIGGSVARQSTTAECGAPVRGAYDPYYGQPQQGPYQQGYSQQYDPRYDQRYAQRDPRDDGELYGGRRSAYEDRGYRRADDCRWSDMVVHDRRGYPHRENVLMCRGRDGEWRPSRG